MPRRSGCAGGWLLRVQMSMAGCRRGVATSPAARRRAEAVAATARRPDARCLRLGATRRWPLIACRGAARGGGELERPHGRVEEAEAWELGAAAGRQQGCSGVRFADAGPPTGVEGGARFSSQLHGARKQCQFANLSPTQWRPHRLHPPQPARAPSKRLQPKSQGAPARGASLALAGPALCTIIAASAPAMRSSEMRLPWAPCPTAGTLRALELLQACAPLRLPLSMCLTRRVLPLPSAPLRRWRSLQRATPRACSLGCCCASRRPQRRRRRGRARDARRSSSVLRD